MCYGSGMIAKTNPAQPPLAVDPATLKTMVMDVMGEYRKATSLIEQLQHQLEKMLRQRFGQKSETIDWNNSLFPKDMIEAILGMAKAEEPVTETVSYERAKPNHAGHGRQILPDHLHRERVVINVPESEKTCSVCDAHKVMIREEISEQLEYVPASLYVKQTVRPVYACPEGHEVSMADKPSSPIEKELAGPGLLSQIVVSKYGDHLPLNRQEDILSRHGVHIPRSTQSDWMRQCAELLKPLYEHLKAVILQSKVVQTDDTPVPVQEKKKTRTGRAWVHLDPIRELAVFDATPDRRRDGPQRFLGTFSGYLQADAYTGYDAIYAGQAVTEVACWAHARRKFHESQTTQPDVALAAMAWIKRLYDVEREAKAYRDALDPDQPEMMRRALYVARRQMLRHKDSTVILAGFGTWLAEQEAKQLPKSPVGQAIAYMRSNWVALNRYVEDSDLEIDNNNSERAMRHAVVGRNNWMFFGSDRGGQTWATLTGLIYSAKLHRLNPFAYMKDVLTRIADTRINDLDQFLPDVWKREHAAGGNASGGEPADASAPIPESGCEHESIP